MPELDTLNTTLWTNYFLSFDINRAPYSNISLIMIITVNLHKA